MRVSHGVALILVLLLGYFVGAAYPSTGKSLLAKVGL